MWWCLFIFTTFCVFAGDRIFMGKNKVARAAFGKTPAEEMRDGLSEAGKRLIGNRGLLFTNASGREVVK
jgi:mRNA turnover protein 4